MKIVTNLNLLVRSICVAMMVVVIAVLPAFLNSCKDNTPANPGPGPGTNTASISGSVFGKRGATQTALSGAVVSIQTIYGSQDTLTDARGGFAFTVVFPDSAKASSATISASKLPDYAQQTQNLIIRPGSDVVVPFTLVAQDTTSIAPTSGAFAQLVFISQTSTFANVQGSGGVQAVSFIFEARDTAGIPLDTTSARRVKVYLKLKPAIGGGEKLSADSLYTSSSIGQRGRVTVVLTAGTVSGLVQVEASAVTKAGVTLKATSQPLPIYSGSPNASHFQMNAEVVNFPGYTVKGLQDKITVQLGDKWSNPVREGTPLVFSSSSGIIQPTATTDADGKATVILTSGDPKPAGGVAWIYAQAIGDSGKIVRDSISILITGAPVINPSSDSLYITIAGGDQLHIKYFVYDAFKHPLSAGTKITVATSGDGASSVLLSGDVNTTLIDTRDSASTAFAFDLRDTIHTLSSNDLSFLVTIAVTSPNGNLTRLYSGTVSGSVGGGGGTGAGPAQKPASIVLSNVTDQQISVLGTGSKQTSVLTFLVLDRNGRFIPRDSATIHFTLFPNTLGAQIFPDSAKTDAQGHVQAILNSGKLSGVVQVMAFTDTGKGLKVYSSPIPVTIASGLPDSSHYSLAVSRFNIPGLQVDGLADTFTVFVGDLNGNPVQSNTAIYFKTDGGIIQPSAYTNAIGSASTVLRSANPRTANGIVTVTATTIDTASRTLSRKAQVIFSGPPIITVRPDTIFLSYGNDKTLNWTVADRNNNPLSSNNVITAALSGPEANQVKFSGDISTTLGDYGVGWSGTPGVTNFHVVLADTVQFRLFASYLTLRLSSVGPNGSAASIDIPVKLLKSTNPSIALIKKIAVTADPTRIYVAGTGALSSSNLTFSIQDAGGNNLPIKGIPVNLTLTGAIGALDSSIIHTDSLGNSYAVFSSGSDTGFASISAQVGDIVSPTKTITILPGKASAIYTSIQMFRPPDTLQKFNIPGAGISAGQKVGEPRLTVKDRHNNPVDPGTIVTLTTTAGTFATGNNTITLSTDKKGEVSTDLFGGLPVPGNGSATITATVPGEGVSTVTKTLNFVYSGAPVITFGLSNGFVFHYGIDTNLTFIVRDARHQPLAQGESVKVFLTGAGSNTAIFTGNVLNGMIDTKDTTAVSFTVHVQDTNKTVTVDRNIGVQISVSGPNGSLNQEVDGTLKAAPPAPFRVLAFISMTSPGITVASAPGVHIDTLTFEIQDSTGHAIRKSGVDIQFIVGTLTATISPTHVVTDNNGDVTAFITSGTLAETVTVRAQANGIYSPPEQLVVQPGPPDASFFALQLLGLDGRKKTNFPGAFGSRDPIGTARVQVKDIYGNVVKIGTAVKFNKNAGSMAAFGFTDKDGFAQVTWLGGNPVPAGGNAFVTAAVLDAANNVIASDSVAVTYSGQALITGNLPSKYRLHHAIDTTFNYTVKDANNNPLSAGSTIQVTASGDGAPSLILSGDVNVTMPDTRLASATNFSVRVIDSNSVNSNIRPANITITVSGPNGDAILTSPDSLIGAPPQVIGGLALVNSTASTVTVKDAGGSETSLLTYELRDILDHPIRRDSVHITFTSQGVPGTFTPTTAATDTAGRVQTLFHSDSVAGVVRVIATINGTGITSSNFKLLIVGGKPAQNYFTFILTRPNAGSMKVNFPGGIPLVQKIGQAEVQMGDRYGNPVPAGTPVYFKTNAGVIQGSALSDGNGFAQVDWFGGNPKPSGDSAIVTASTLGSNGTAVSASANVTYSGVVKIATALPANYVFKSGIDTTINYTVSDVDGNPLAEGTTIQVVATGDGASSILLMGDVNVTMPDTRSAALTNYSVRIRDTNTVFTTARNFVISIQVAGPNGTANLQLNGSIKGENTTVAGIALVSIGSQTLTVKNTGGTETTLLTYQLLDSLGKPNRSSGVGVSFNHFGVPGTFSPAVVKTDENGQAITLFRSDSIAGLVNVSATVAAPLVTSLQTQIVIAGGRPAQAYFSFILTRTAGKNVNFPGVNATGQQIGTAQVQAGDRYGNPVPVGTIVYFTTNAGVIQANASTDANGFASVNWFGGNPVPPGGLAKVKVSIIGEAALLTDSAIVAYSGSPIIAINLSANFSFKHGIDTTITYTVKDANNQPLAQGETYQFSATGPGSSALELTGDVNVLMNDTQSPAATSFTVHIRDTSTVASVNRAVSFTVSAAGPNGTANQKIDGTLQGIVTTPPQTAGVFRLNLISTSATQLSVKNGGGTETSLLTYELEDSLGNPVHQDSIQISFAFSGVPGTFTPGLTMTDANGQVQTAFTSGTVAGVVEIDATVVGKGITSTQAHLSIVGGKPSSNYFTFIVSRTPVSGRKVNYPGAVPSIQNIGEAQVQVGDKYGNPVPVGTTVYFTTNAGVIQGTAATDANGFATVNWFGGNPVPPTEIAVLQASAIGDTGKFTVKDSVVYSGLAIIANGPPSGFQIPGAGVANFNFQITDALGLPISEGSSVVVSASGPGAAPLVLSGAVNVTTPDTKNPAGESYSFTAFDSSVTSTTNRPVSFTISVNGPNGSTFQTFNGELLAIGVSHGSGDTTRSRLPGSIALISVSNTDIQVAGTGGPETSTLVFEVRDSLGVPVDSGYQVKFTLLNPPAGTYISPISGRSDSTTGRINAILHSDSVAGVVQIQAIVTSPGNTIKSTPVLITIHSGLPDQRHFSLYPTSRNFAGLQLFNVFDTINVIVGDRYSNPVSKGTAVYFNTHAGVIEPSGFTDDIGEASVHLISGRPFPDDSNVDPDSGHGFSKIYATTDGLNGSVVKDSILILFSGVPIVEYGGPGNFVTTYGSCVFFSVVVSDLYGHPISPGSGISLNVSSAAQGLKVSDPVTMVDAQSEGPGLTQFTFSFCTAPPDPNSPPNPASASVFLDVTWMGRIFHVFLASGTIN